MKLSESRSILFIVILLALFGLLGLLWFKVAQSNFDPFYSSLLALVGAFILILLLFFPLNTDKK